MGEGGFEGVVGAEDVDVDDGFEGVGAELSYGSEKVACCAGAVWNMLAFLISLEATALWFRSLKT